MYMQNVSEDPEVGLSTLIHNVRSPFSVLKGYTQLLLHQEQSLSAETLHEYLAEMHEACTALDAALIRLIDHVGAPK
jgi:signal transduction histidine kinase